MINYTKHQIYREDIREVVKVLKSDSLTQGKKVNEFEIKLKKKFKSKFCNVVSNGTAALHLAGMALGWTSKDIIITTPLTFLASANAILYSGARPDFVDINSRDFNIDLNILEEKIKKLKHKQKIKSVIAVDYAGQPCDWEGLQYLSKKFSFSLINDNCHALGSKYYNDPGYAVKYADIVTHSYHATKNITSGEGGSLLTNNKDIYEKTKLLRSHGVYKSKNLDSKNGLWFYEMRKLGFNYRLSDINCALGISQLKKLTQFVKFRRKIAKIYNEGFSEIEFIETPLEKPNCHHSYHLYPLRINFDKFKIDKKKFFKKFLKIGVKLQVHYIPIFFQPYYKNNFKFNIKNFKNTMNFYKKEVSLPIYPNLSLKNINYVIKNTKKILKIN